MRRRGNSKAIMKSKPLAVVGAGVTTLALITGTAVTSRAETPEPAPITVEPLTPRSEFTDRVRMQFRVKPAGRRKDVIRVADPSRTLVAKITVQPGAQFPWHTHPGPVVANVVEGELTYVYADDCVHRPYPSGTAFIDPGQGNVHTAYNSTDGVTTVIATFFQAPAEGPVTIPADAPAGCVVGGTTHAH